MAVAAHLCAASEQVDWKLEPLVEPPIPAGAATVPFLKDSAATAWHEGMPVWSGQSAHASVRCWMATSREGVRVYVAVAGPQHENAFHGRDLWRGDCLYLDLDARCDPAPVKPAKSGSSSKEAAGSSASDTAFIFGLTDKGPEGRLNSRDPLVPGGDCTGLVRAITRDEGSKTTVYDLAIPWSVLHSGPGQSRSIGVALNAAEAIARPGKLDVLWGTPGRELCFVELLDDPEGAPFASIAPKETRVTDDATVEAEVALRANHAAINVRVGDRRHSFQPASSAHALQRFIISIPATAFSPAADSLVVTVESDDGVHAAETLPVTTPALVYASLTQRLAKLRETAPNDLVRRHLAATQIIVEDEYCKLPFEKESHPERIDAFTSMVALITGKLPAERFDFDALRLRGRPLVFAFVSETDGTLQFARLQLPFDWRPDGGPYPLTVYLHGYGIAEPIRALAGVFDDTREEATCGNEEMTPENAPAVHRGFILSPWARGNSWYQGAAANDVLQALQWVEAHYKVDPDRRYMSGFSMGGSGAWGIAAATPDLWAGVGVASGFAAWSATAAPNLLENGRALPTVLAVGELEHAGMQDAVRQMQNTLISLGNSRTKLMVAPGLKHDYRHAEFCANVAWLMQFVRPPPPRAFAFIATDAQHIGRNGIVLLAPFSAVGFATGKAPRFRCTIDGNTVRIDTENVNGANIALGPGGLGLTGEIEVIWNGHAAYKGEAKQITLTGERGD